MYQVLIFAFLLGVRGSKEGIQRIALINNIALVGSTVFSAPSGEKYRDSIPFTSLVVRLDLI